MTKSESFMRDDEEDPPLESRSKVEEPAPDEVEDWEIKEFEVEARCDSLMRRRPGGYGVMWLERVDILKEKDYCVNDFVLFWERVDKGGRRELKRFILEGKEFKSGFRPWD